ncbi:Ger(x)C family spore germination protein [Tissierella creatinophila]|uniref:Ger(x)C family spore germination protein n=1 Tax=Tissierella creatinophila TaxID=79681 RepID=UPI00095175FC|nr:Ger(x)C family spore germination protein [Tissierella creatinophila]
MNKSKKRLLVFIIIISNIFLTSCKSAKEIDTLGIVVAVGFDLDGEDVIITNEVINPMGSSTSQQSSGQESTKFVIGQGKTIEEAILNTSLTFDRELYYPHAHTIIVGEDLVKDGFDGYIDMLSRDKQLRETTFLMVAKGAKAYEIMGINSGLSNSPGRYLHDITQENMETGKQRPLDINRFLKYFYRKSGGVVLGVVEKRDKKTANKDGKADTIEVLSVEGGVVLKEKKLVGYFTGEEMMGFNFIVGEFQRGPIVFQTPEDDKDKGNFKKNHYSTFKVFKNKTTLDMELKKDKLHLFIDLKLRGALKATQEGVDLNNPNIVKEMEKSIEKEIKRKIATTLEKAQNEFNVDTFSIAELTHRKYPELWKEIEDQWPEIFKDLDYTIRVDASINDVGFINTTKKTRESIYE